MGVKFFFFMGKKGGVNDHLKPFLQYVTTFLSVKSRENMKNSWIHDKLQIVMNQSWGVKILLRENEAKTNITQNNFLQQFFAKCTTAMISLFPLLWVVPNLSYNVRVVAE